MARRSSRAGKRSTRKSTGSNEAEAYARIAAEPDFARLRHNYRRFAFPATIAFMLWYVTYVVCNNWARDFMDTRLVGHVNVAVVFGLAQFASTFVIAFFYARYARRSLDPLAAGLQEQFEQETRR